MTSLDDLIARLEAAEGPDRELDGLVAAEIGFLHPAYPRVSWSIHRQTFPAAPVWSIVPAFTSSIDTAVTLVPAGWSWRVASCSVSDDAWVQPDFNCPVHGERLRRDLDESVDWIEITDVDLRPPGRPAIALCAALMKAKMAMENEL